MEFGISTFGETPGDQGTGSARNAHLRMQELLAEAKLADELGLDVFALGEHHRPDYMISAPEVALAGVATKTGTVRGGRALSGYATTVGGRAVVFSIIGNGDDKVLTSKVIDELVETIVAFPG